ncbi:MAG: PTS sugar transporter subunit IIA [Candidatus Omnitrophica bacterium]|nr:PTS sugar transporter subunit IIA [Candidatus Omnitrophota bacterium]MCF7893897.1 PTS sugar transporter subunit IIA [Candidatus Omnitrophota bacterium]
MAVSTILRKDCCLLELKGNNKKDAICEIGEELKKTKKIKNYQQFVKDVLNREKLGSTGIGNKIAIPHARTDSVKDIVIGFGKTKEGIDFNALDGEKVKLIFLMGANPKQLNLYLRILAEISKLLMNEGFRQSLLEAKEADKIINTIKHFENNLK